MVQLSQKCPIVGDGAVSEGENAVFTVSTNESDTTRTAPLAVAISVSEGPTNFLAGTHSDMVEIRGGTISAKYQVPTTGDTTPGTNNGTITANVEPGPYYRRSTTEANNSATVTINDDGGPLQALQSGGVGRTNNRGYT